MIGRVGGNVDSGGSARRLAETLRDGDATQPIARDDEPQAGARIGRYVLLERIGAGGMGVVFAAFDPDLDRRVALKLLRGSADDGRADLRLLREARALAKLTHPNVVPVFDVGTVGGRAWVAMELVEGQTLTRWLAAAPRSRADVLRVFVEAGRGLVAAHAIGIVHRDVKPDNVLIGDDGRVRVGDFGLARPAIDAAASGLESSHDTDASARMDPVPLTVAGVVLGTPAYMAPEQHRGEATPASDQYALCVALYEALFGVRPFTAISVRELVRQKSEGRLAPPPTDRKVPAWLRDAIARGLAPAPGDRWPDLATLIERLEHGPRRRRRLAVALVVGTTAVAIAAALPGGTAPCSDDPRLSEVWNADVRAGARAAFAATGLGYAQASWTRTEALVDAYAEAWAGLRHDTCVAATARPGASSAPIDRRSRCLDDRLAALGDLVGVLVDADDTLVRHAVSTASALPPIHACVEPGDAETDPDPARAAERQSIARGLTRVLMLENAGRYHVARGEAELLLGRAERLGDTHMMAAANEQLGSALHRTGEYERARKHLREGVYLGTAAGEDIATANAAIGLVWLEGVDLADADTALEWARHAAAAVERSGEDQGRAQLANALGAVHSHRGDHREALEEFERARELYARLGEATRSDVATAHQNIGITLGGLGRHADGLAQLETALAIYEDVQGPDHPETANTLDAIAGEMMHLGDLAGARVRFERALAVRTAALPENHLDVARSYNNLGSLLDATGEWGQAEHHFDRALGMFEASLGAEHPFAAVTLANLANVRHRRGDPAEARVLLERALAILVAEMPADHGFVLQTTAWLARAEAVTGNDASARRHAATVIAACEKGAGDPAICAQARFAQARVEARAGASDRGRALAREAIDALRSAGAVATHDVAEIERWLAAQ
jgi:tetratricopeptide (TPR) repeat protein